MAKEARAVRGEADVGGDAGLDHPTTSWDQVVDEQQERVYRLALHLTRNPHDAADLTNDVFVRIFTNLHTFSPGNFDAWVTRITYNLFRDQWRRRQRVRMEGLPDGAGELLPAAATTEQVWHERHLDLDVRRALDALPERFRLPVILCDIEQMTYEEIAELLDIKLGTVRSRIFRGRAQLRERLQQGPTTEQEQGAQNARALKPSRRPLPRPALAAL